MSYASAGYSQDDGYSYSAPQAVQTYSGIGDEFVHFSKSFKSFNRKSEFDQKFNPDFSVHSLSFVLFFFVENLSSIWWCWQLQWPWLSIVSIKFCESEKKIKIVISLHVLILLISFQNPYSFLNKEQWKPLVLAYPNRQTLRKFYLVTAEMPTYTRRYEN